MEEYKMDKIRCPKCGEIITENPECVSTGIITCDECKEKVIWKCDGKETIAKIYTY
ncbi:hypothetical protein HMPREF0216_00173 [Clostridium celatum DSM 1785]|uniref:Uncharacterized protein n=2 Tax=Clostridium celatum TaxID=36834 RepID=L1QPF7_9CLOT|nr:hypothetical protein HMPREF0216_00173 [Clostridium celatum DSM 1785]